MGSIGWSVQQVRFTKLIQFLYYKRSSFSFRLFLPPSTHLFATQLLSQPQPTTYVCPLKVALPQWLTVLDDLDH